MSLKQVINSNTPLLVTSVFFFVYGIKKKNTIRTFYSFLGIIASICSFIYHANQNDCTVHFDMLFAYSMTVFGVSYIFNHLFHERYLIAILLMILSIISLHYLTTGSEALEKRDMETYYKKHVVWHYLSSFTYVVLMSSLFTNS